MPEARIGSELCGLLPGKPRSVVPTLLTLLAMAASGWGPLAEFAARADEPLGTVPDQRQLKAIVATLTSAEMQGRRGEGARKAAAYLVDAFQKLRLEPLFGGQFLQQIPASEPGRIQGRNVGAMLRGIDPVLRDQWIIVSAHYDHLGIRRGVLYPGADDNASGVAMLLEVARAISGSPEPPRRSLMFVAFDLEEIGLFGSRYFVAHPPVPLPQVALFMTADMIGRSLGGVCKSHVFVLGTENAPGLRDWIGQAAHERPLTVGLLGSDILILNRSDYGPFRTRRVPYLFFSTGENPCYHSPEDKPETLDYAKLTAISQMIHGVTRTAAAADTVPRWSDAPDHSLAEAITMRDVIARLLENQQSLKLSPAQLFLMKHTMQNLAAIIARGAMSETERSGVVQAVRVILLMLQ